MKIENVFWTDVLKSWCDCTSPYEKRIENSIIWYNIDIRMQNKPIMWNDVYKNGLKYVYQLFIEGEYKPTEQVMREFGLICLRYNSLKKAIPKEIK